VCAWNYNDTAQTIAFPIGKASGKQWRWSTGVERQAKRSCRKPFWAKSDSEPLWEGNFGEGYTKVSNKRGKDMGMSQIWNKVSITKNCLEEGNKIP
jgi:hypothetical protein